MPSREPKCKRNMIKEMFSSNTLRGLFALKMIASIVSGCMTGWAVLAYISTQTNAYEVVLIGTILGMAFLQIGILVFWALVFGSYGFRVSLLAFALGLGFSAVSVIFAAGSWTLAIDRSNLQEWQDERQTAEMTGPLGKLNQRLREFSTIMQRVAMTAENRAAVEKRSGRSCQGMQNLRSCGPICRMRLRHKAKSHDLSVKASRLADRAIGIVEELRKKGYSQDAMTTAFKNATGLAYDPAFGEIRSWLDNAVQGFSSGFTDPDTGKAFTCRDPHFVRLLKQAAKTIGKPIELPATPPKRIEVKYIHSVSKVVHDVVEAIFSYSMDELPTGFWPAFFNDLFIVVMVLLEYLVKGRLGLKRDLRDEFYAVALEYDPALKSKYEAWVRLLTQLMLEEGGEFYFCRPMNPTDPGLIVAGRELVTALGLRPHRRLNSPIPLPQLYPDWVAARQALHQGATEFMLYPLTRKHLDWLHRVERNLMVA